MRIKALRTLAGSVASESGEQTAESRRPVPGAAHLGGTAASESLGGSRLTGVGHGGRLRGPPHPRSGGEGSRGTHSTPHHVRDAQWVLPLMRESSGPPLGTGDTERSHVRPAGVQAAQRWPTPQVVGRDTEPRFPRRLAQGLGLLLDVQPGPGLQCQGGAGGPAGTPRQGHGHHKRVGASTAPGPQCPCRGPRPGRLRGRRALSPAGGSCSHAVRPAEAREGCGPRRQVRGPPSGHQVWHESRQPPTSCSLLPWVDRKPKPRPLL